MKKALLLPLAVCLFGAASAQVRCNTDEVHSDLVKQHPEISAMEQELIRQIDRNMKNLNVSSFAKTTAADSDNKVTYHIPIVFHVIHNYDNTMLNYASDNAILQCVADINRMYNRQNADTSEVIATYAGNIPNTHTKYIGKANIVFHLATKDPEGNPTRGITHRRSYLTDAAGNVAKFDIWPPNRYMNVWVINQMGASNQGAAAFALKPADAASVPFYDGVITLASYLNIDNTVSHELGHTLSLDHPWGGTNQPEVACGDDGVDDTPPTDGHNPPNGNNGCTNLAHIYDTKCVLADAQFGKSNINPLKDKVSSAVGLGTKFKAYDRLYIDSVKFYPAEAGNNFQIALKNGNTVISTYNGVTTFNSTSFVNGSLGKLSISNVMPDSVNGEGLTLMAYEPVRISSLSFNYADTPAIRPYTIALQKNGVTIDSFSGNTTATAVKVTAPVGFDLDRDSVNAYSIVFTKNPYAFRDTISTGYPKNIGQDVVVIDDSTGGYYNYFYGLSVRYGNYIQTAPVKFVTPSLDTNAIYSVEFTVNPKVKVDTFSTGYPLFAADIFRVIDDTTNGYYNGLYNWGVRYGNYFKVYSPETAKTYFGIDDTVALYVDYPDTVNSQNVMDYTYCSKMFTHLQTLRMRAALETNVANRHNLIDSANLAMTGAFEPLPDLAPTPDFSINNDKVFTCVGAANAITFVNRSWNDTVTSVRWTFSNDATIPTSTSMTNVANNFGTSGWASVSLTAKSNGNADSSTLVVDSAVYVAPAQGINALGYVEEFAPTSTMLDQYPMFNFFKNDHKWELVNYAGAYDNYCMRYANKDNRVGIQTVINSPGGDMDDFYTPGFALNQFSGPAYLTFKSAGAFTTNDLTKITDVLEIDYSTNCGGTWTSVARVKNAELGNNGTVTNDFVPIWSDWKSQSFSLSAGAKAADKVHFRFRFKPGAFNNIGTGNNFYIDRISISEFPLSVDETVLNEKGFALAPNPTTSSTSIIIKNNGSKSAQVRVTDITGKVIYTTEASLSGNVSRIEIPASAITVKGMYMVQVTTGNSSFSEKLIVY